jgi:hypothetical protein
VKGTDVITPQKIVDADEVHTPEPQATIEALSRFDYERPLTKLPKPGADSEVS